MDHLTYGSFGNITAQSNSANQPLFAYTGQMWDTDAGLYYYHARWYNPLTGRFLSQDPLSFAAGDTDLYRYVRNSPVNFTDPNGMQAAPVRGNLESYFAAGYLDSTDYLKASSWGEYGPRYLRDPVFQKGWTQFVADMAPGTRSQQLAIEHPELFNAAGQYIPALPLPAESSLTTSQQLSLYYQNAVLNGVLGEMSGAPANAGSTAISIGMSVTGTDLPKDIADLGHSLYNYKPTLADTGKVALGTVALFPLIGAIKPLIKGTGVAADAAKTVNAASALKERGQASLMACLVSVKMPGCQETRESALGVMCSMFSIVPWHG